MTGHFNDRPAAETAVILIGAYVVLGVGIFAAIAWIVLRGAS